MCDWSAIDYPQLERQGLHRPELLLNRVSLVILTRLQVHWWLDI
jgi:hypothetical protein